MRFKDQVVLITGSGSGQGRAEAVLFAEEGARVVVNDINKEGADETAEMIKKNTPSAEVLVSYADVRDEGQVKAMVEETVEKFKKIDVLVNNAGVVRGHPIPETEQDEFYEVIDTNLKGPLLCCKYVLPHMEKAKKGAIINIASISAFIAKEGLAVYASSKGALVAMTRVLALDYAQYGIRVNAIGPGWTDTPMTKPFFDDENIKKALLADIPMGRFAASEEQAKAVLFLASDDASYIQGQTLLVDGGWTIR